MTGRGRAVKGFAVMLPTLLHVIRRHTPSHAPNVATLKSTAITIDVECTVAMSLSFSFVIEEEI
jgi:hypothetical protein